MSRFRPFLSEPSNRSDGVPWSRGLRRCRKSFVRDRRDLPLITVKECKMTQPNVAVDLFEIIKARRLP